ncbi:MAG: glycoside hydrolase family 15 protein [Proteobacteria bacterium]|nr:glycoside hydrolase family 15 protein [Pseudomonadota bacterium]
MSAGRPSLDLAVVGNCQVAALIDRQANVVWMCLPRPDGDPVFSALLTGEGGGAARGGFAVDLADLVRFEQHYERNTAILRTELHDRHGGSVRITDFCPRYRHLGRMFRPMMLVRIVEPLEGRPVVRLRLRPNRGCGAETAPVRVGSHHLSYSAAGIDYRLTTDASLALLQEERAQVLDRAQVFVLGPDESIAESPGVLAQTLLHETRAYWIDWVRTLALPFEWQAQVIRAAITLKLCTYEDTGAVLAALTTSIPESPDSGRNWDYRYCWLRDAYFVARALNSLGATRTTEAYLHFIEGAATASAGGELQPLYGLSGETQLPESCVDTLPGYRGMGPVRIGNQAALQTQHDVYGAVILAATQLFFDERLVRSGDAALLSLLERIGERAAAVYALPDAGPWEFRAEQHVHTYSAAMSWAGCARLGRIWRHLGRHDMAEKWRQRSEAMRRQVLATAWSERRQSFVARAGGDDLDATLLLLPELGILPSADPRFVATVHAVERELSAGPLLYRYRHTDDFGAPKTAFTVCAFWFVDALCAIGEVDRARERFESLLRYCNHVGLLSEDIDPQSAELWGNFPQTYSLVGLINSALRLSRPWHAVV